MVELLELLAAADISGHHNAAAVLQLTGEQCMWLMVSGRDHSGSSRHQRPPAGGSSAAAHR
jgi:hypothetical protein